MISEQSFPIREREQPEKRVWTAISCTRLRIPPCPLFFHFLSSHHKSASYKIFFLGYLDFVSKSFNSPLVVDSVSLSVNHRTPSRFQSSRLFCRKEFFQRHISIHIRGKLPDFDLASAKELWFVSEKARIRWLSSLYGSNPGSLSLHRDKHCWWQLCGVAGPEPTFSSSV